MVFGKKAEPKKEPQEPKLEKPKASVPKGGQIVTYHGKKAEVKDAFPDGRVHLLPLEDNPKAKIVQWVGPDEYKA